MKAFLKSFFAGCWFSHGNRVRARNENGQRVLRCEDCGDEQLMLTSAIVKGPKHEPDRVAGAPVFKIKPLRPGKKLDFPRQSER